MSEYTWGDVKNFWKNKADRGIDAMGGGWNRAKNAGQFLERHSERVGRGIHGTVTGKGASRFTGGLAGAGKKAFTSLPIGMVAFGLPFAVAEHDPTKNTFGSHMARESTKLGADIVADSLLFGGGMSMANLYGGATAAGVAGLGLAAVTIGAYSLGMNAGAQVGEFLDYSESKYRRSVGMSADKPMTQNKQTMQATQRALSLVGQTSTTNSMLGSEAQFMHN